MTTAATTQTDRIHYLHATTLAALIRKKQLSSREVVQAHLVRVAAVNPRIYAVVTLMADDALKSADAADKMVSTAPVLGPLHGVPFSIKDSFDTAGVLTKRGSKMFARNIPDKDATAVERLKAAGDIPWRVERYACDFALQFSHFALALGPVRFQFGEAPDWYSTRLQVAG